MYKNAFSIKLVVFERKIIKRLCRQTMDMYRPEQRISEMLIVQYIVKVMKKTKIEENEYII